MATLARGDIQLALERLADDWRIPGKSVSLSSWVALLSCFSMERARPRGTSMRLCSVDRTLIFGRWLNDASKGYVHGVALGELVLQRGHLEVRALDPNQLLAMKLSAWRDDVDIADAKLLLSKLSGRREEIWERIERHLVPGRELKARYAFEDLWESQNAS